MRKIVNSMFAFAALLFAALPAQAEVVQAEQIEVELIAETVNVVPGQTLWLAIRLEPAEHWHTYSKWPGDSGEATRATQWEVPEGAQVGEIHWPTPEWLPFPGSELVTFSYEREVFLPIPIEVPESLEGDSFDVSTFVEWQVCEQICLLGDATLSLSLPIRGESPEPDPKWEQAFAETRDSLPLSPEEHDINGLFAVAGERISLLFESDQRAFSSASEAWFFPERRRIIDPAPLRDVSIVPGLVQITHGQPRRMLEDLSEVNGVLVIADEDGNTQGYEIVAQPATQENVAAAAQAFRDEGAAGGQNLLMIMLFALAGGLILNLMPCVLPVLSLKVLSFVSKQGVSPGERRLHGISYTAGIVLSFMLLASVLLVLRAGGEAVGWAFQLQSPWFVALLIYLFFVMGLSLSGVFDLGTSLMGTGSKLTEKGGYQGSFFTGVLATVVASPCTAPFMGAALGFALSQSWLVAMVVFISLGLGMAIPFLLLSFIPALAQYMPKPGAWMVTFKEFMAFPLYATVIWLLWVLGSQVGVNGMAAVVGACLLLAFGLWLYQKRLTVGPFWRVANALVFVISVFTAFYVLQTPFLETRAAGGNSALAGEAGEQNFEPFSAQRLSELRAAGQPVFVNMTAAWCITCLANEQTSLSSDRVKEAMVEKGITYLKGDWTNEDPEITAVLNEFNRPSVPLYLLYPADQNEQPTILPQILTPSIVVNAFDAI